MAQEKAVVFHDDSDYCLISCGPAEADLGEGKKACDDCFQRLWYDYLLHQYDDLFMDEILWKRAK